MAKTALVTLAIGQDYSERFEKFCRQNWTAYAQRYGFDIFVFKEPLDTSDRAAKRSPAWQKCLVLSAPKVADYERVVWIDADVCINPMAPPIMADVPIESIGAIDEHRFPTPEIRKALLHEFIAASPESGGLDKRFWRAWLEPGAWHGYMGLPTGQAHIVQTGVMVLTPKHHRQVLEHVYRTYDDGGSNLFNYEMRPLSHEIQARALQHWIDQRFNALVWWMSVWWMFRQSNVSGGRTPTQTELSAFVRVAYRSSYFLHFAGAANLMPLLAP